MPRWDRLLDMLALGVQRLGNLLSAYDTATGARAPYLVAPNWLPGRKNKQTLSATHPLGHVDHISDGIIRGWAWDPERPKFRLELDVFYRGIFLGQVSTGRFRRDLAEHSIGDGRHAFVFHLPSDVPADVDVEKLCVATAGPEHRHALNLPGHLARDRSHLLAPDLREMLGSYLASLQAADDGPAQGKWVVGKRGRIATICAKDVDVDASAFVVHVARKHERPELQAQDPAELWRWYVGAYAVEHGPRLAPLSREDLEILRGRVGRRAPLRDCLEAGIRDRGIARSYALAVDASRRVFMEDCLIDARDIRKLRRTRIVDAFQAFPLSRFMTLLRHRTAVLRGMPSTSAEDRRKLYVVIMVLALRSPHLLQFLPSAWLRRLVEDRSTFDTTIPALFGPRCAIDKSRWLKLVSATGFDLETQTFSGRFYAGHRVLGGATIIAPTPTVDVQIFGPIRCRKGLGESCRRIVQALRDTGYTVNVVDYDIGDSAGNPAVPVAAPLAARLNILHLNAEEIPEAIAFLPDVFSNVPLVAIPYWELDRPSAVHRLGLDLVDEVWVASRFLADVFAGCGKPVHWIGMSYSNQRVPAQSEREAVRAHFQLRPPTFVYLTSSDALSWTQRKNPLGVLEAFRAAFPSGEDVALLLKTRNLDGALTPSQQAIWDEIRAACGLDERVVFVDEFLEAYTQRTLLAASDCYVSLHRAEGLGLDVLDAFDLGVPVVATAYSGTMEYATPETSWLVPATLAPVDGSAYCYVEPGQLWAEPDRDVAHALMRAVRDDATRRRERIAAGKAAVAAGAGRDALASRLGRRIGELLSRPPGIV